MAKSKSSKKNANGTVNGTETTSPMMPLETASAVAAEITTAEVSPAEARTVVRKSTRKPELLRTDSRSNLFPINLEDEIRQLAYLLSERRGFEPGHETEDWLKAEHEVMDRYHHPATA